MPNPASSNDDVMQQLEKAEQLKMSGQYQAAISLLEQLLVQDPRNVSAYEEIADNELSLNHFDRAEQAAKQAIQFDAKSYTGYYILGFVRSHFEQWKEAVELLQRANEMKANNPEILRCLGWALFNEGKRAQGIVTLERALNLDGNNPLTLCDLGVAYLQLQNFAKARHLFQRVLDLDPENPRARECLHAIDRLQQAMERTSAPVV